MYQAQHFDLCTNQLDDGTIHISQTNYSGETETVAMHPDQLRAIADQFAPAASKTSTTPADVVLRRFKAVVEAIRAAAWKEWLYKDIWESCDSETANALYVGLNAAMAMADQFIEDSEATIVTPVTQPPMGGRI